MKLIQKPKLIKVTTLTISASIKIIIKSKIRIKTTRKHKKERNLHHKDHIDFNLYF